MSLRDKVIGAKADKKAYREYRRRVDALPREYNIVMNELQSYIWGASGVLSGGLDLLSDALALFEASAADGRRVLDVTGDDVAAFFDGLVREWQERTWQGDMRAKSNARIHKKLESLENGRD